MATTGKRTDFLEALHVGCEGVCELRALPSKARTFIRLGDDKALTRFATARTAENVYIAVATRKDASSGELENCHHLAALYTDNDFKMLSEPEARERLARFPLTPSAVVFSGGGLHAYWFLREPMALPEEDAAARSLLRRLAHALGADLASAEPARVLRVPGTLNQKYAPARRVVLETLDPARRYNPTDFDGILPPEPSANGRGVAFTMPDEPLAEGEGRNNALYRLVRALRSKNVSAKSIVVAAEAENARFRPPLPDAELHALLQHALTQPDRPTFTAPAAQPARGDHRPEIDTANLGLDEMAAAAWAALEAANDPPRIFLFGNVLAWLATAAGSLNVDLMNQDHVRHHLADIATFIRWTLGGRGRAPEKKPAFPPVALAADLLAVPRATLPRLQRLVRMPAFTADGRLLETPGFDAASGLYFAPPDGMGLPPIAAEPSAQEIASARELLCVELLGDFPFVTAADRAHALALLLTLLLREMVSGSVPLFVVSKPTPRTGAGLLTKVVSIIQGGGPIAATTLSREEEENRKRLTALLIPTPSMILLDNLHGRLDSPALASILTTSTWDDRLLGRSQTLRLTVRSTFVVTGNNVALSNEMAGRAVLVRLDPKVEDPSTRTGFRHPNLESWTVANRPRLLWAALTLVRAWVAAGRPRAEIAFGGFEEWAGVLGGVLTVAGIEGFLGNRRQLFEKADEESAHVRAFLADWWATHGDSPVLVKALIELAKGHPLPIASRSEQGTLIRLGQLVQSLEDRRYILGGGLTVTVKRAGELRRAVLWRLACESDESCESSSVIAYARAGGDECKTAGKDSQDSQDSHTEVVAGSPTGRDEGEI